jgi:hypothetical protein
MLPSLQYKHGGDVLGNEDCIGTSKMLLLSFKANGDRIYVLQRLRLKDLPPSFYKNTGGDIICGQVISGSLLLAKSNPLFAGSCFENFLLDAVTLQLGFKLIGAVFVADEMSEHFRWKWYDVTQLHVAFKFIFATIAKKRNLKELGLLW